MSSAHTHNVVTLPCSLIPTTLNVSGQTPLKFYMHQSACKPACRFSICPVSIFHPCSI